MTDTEVVQETLRRGDANADGNIDIADAVFTLTYLLGTGSPPSCMDTVTLTMLEMWTPDGLPQATSSSLQEEP